MVSRLGGEGKWRVRAEGFGFVSEGSTCLPPHFSVSPLPLTSNFLSPVPPPCLCRELSSPRCWLPGTSLVGGGTRSPNYTLHRSAGRIVGYLWGLRPGAWGE